MESIDGLPKIVPRDYILIVKNICNYITGFQNSIKQPSSAAYLNDQPNLHCSTIF